MFLTQDLIDTAKFYFNVDLPVSSIVLKKEYRKRCIELHPDVGGDIRAFKEMQQAYNKLTESSCIADVFSSEEEYKEIKKTICNTPLSELGLGLGPTVNGADCPVCNHKGYETYHEEKTLVCDRCGGDGYEPMEVACTACNGTGKFTQARSRRVVDCLRCNGSGKVKTRVNHNRSFFGFYGCFCSKCRGTGTLRVANEKVQCYVKCHRCNGTGEIPMWNPVILKGSLTNTHKKRK